MKQTLTNIASKPYRRFVSGIERTVASAVRAELARESEERSRVEISEIEAPSPVQSDVQGLDPVDVNREITAVWEQHDDEAYRQDQSHWRGVGRWDADQWSKIGDETWRRIGDAYRSAGRTFPTDPPPVALEWGPGGGSNLFRLASHCKTVYGVDISQKNLDETARVLEEKSGTSFVPITLSDEPATIAGEVAEPIDLFFSTQVFQHFPSKEYGVAVLTTMRSLMSQDGVGYVQIRFDNGNPTYAPKTLDEYRQKHITATSYELSEFWSALISAGFEPIKIANINVKSNFAGFYFKCGRAPSQQAT